MGTVQNLSALALRQLIDGACKALGIVAIETGSDAVVGFLTNRFTDHSLRLTRALHQANDHAWKALEISLAGESWWERCRVLLARREEQAFRRQVQAFLDATPLAGLSSHGKEFREQCVRELRAARTAGALGGPLEPAELARQAGAFARYTEPLALLDAEWQAVGQIADDLRRAHYSALADFLTLRPAGDSSLLATAVRYFFRRAVETDRELFQGLAFAQLESLGQAQETGFAGLAEALAQHGERLEALLGDLLEAAVETRFTVLDIQAEQQRHGQQVQELYDAVMELKRRHDLPASEVRPGDSLRIGSEGERQLVKEVLGKFRALPAEQQQRLPALLNSLAQLEVGAGLFDAAQRDFLQVAALVSDRSAQAEAHANAYQTALERRAWDEALAALEQAARLDAERFAPFPLSKYEPQRILGAGGFGVAFLCRHRNAGSRVVIKALRTDDLERDVDEVFREAQVLEELDHPAIIRLRDCDYADAARTRPFLVMDYFEGLTLADHVEQHGPLTADHLLALARAVAEALHAAHARGILHRDIKPANLLVRHESGVWRVKLIDFGLALKPDVLHAGHGSAAGCSQTLLGGSVAGTVDYGAPEQMGRLAGVAVGPYSDVYGFGKMCCFALFKTVQPLRKHWRQVPEPLADLLEHCLGETPEERPADFAAVLDRLAEMTRTSAVHPPEPEPVQPARTAKGEGSTLQSTPDDIWRKLPTSVLEESIPVGELRRFEGHTDSVLSVAFSAGGLAISGSRDRTVRMWTVEQGREHRLMKGHMDDIWSVAVSEFPGPYCAFSASTDKTVRMWGVEVPRQLRCFDDATNRCMALSRDFRSFLTGSVYDGMVRLWDLQSGREVRRFRGHTAWVMSLAFSPDGKFALSGSQDGTARLWETDTGRELHCLRGPSGWVLSVAFSPDGWRALSGGKDGSIWLWNRASGKPGGVLKGHTDWVNSVAFSSDGSRALSGSHDCTLRLWQVDTGRELHCFEGHTGAVLSVAVSPDGRYALSGSEDNTLRLWRLPDEV